MRQSAETRLDAALKEIQQIKAAEEKRMGLAAASGQVIPPGDGGAAPGGGAASGHGYASPPDEVAKAAEFIIGNMNMGDYSPIDLELAKEVWANPINLRKLVAYRPYNGMTLLHHASRCLCVEYYHKFALAAPECLGVPTYTTGKPNHWLPIHCWCENVLPDDADKAKKFTDVIVDLLDKMEPNAIFERTGQTRSRDGRASGQQTFLHILASRNNYGIINALLPKLKGIVGVQRTIALIDTRNAKEQGAVDIALKNSVAVAQLLKNSGGKEQLANPKTASGKGDGADAWARSAATSGKPADGKGQKRRASSSGQLRLLGKHGSASCQVQSRGQERWQPSWNDTKVTRHVEMRATGRGLSPTSPASPSPDGMAIRSSSPSLGGTVASKRRLRGWHGEHSDSDSR